MELYYNPVVRILTIQRRILQAWHHDQPKLFFWRVYWNSESGATIQYKKQVVALTPDRIVLVPPDTPIGQRLTRAPVNHFYSHFLANPPFDQLHDKIYTFDTESILPDAISSLCPVKEYRMINDLGISLAVRGLIHLLLSRIPVSELPSLEITPRLAASMSFVEAHIKRPLSNAGIAQHLGSSVNTMMRLYQSELGISPQAYLRQKRIEKACALLHDPMKSIEQIAEETGFCDRYHFSRTFKALQGVTPLQYRQQF